MSGETLGMRIRRLRKAKRWTQYDLAAEAEAARFSVMRWELGIREPKLGSFRLLARALGVTMDDLIEGTDGNVLAGHAPAGVAGRD